MCVCGCEFVHEANLKQPPNALCTSVNSPFLFMVSTVAEVWKQMLQPDVKYGAGLLFYS